MLQRIGGQHRPRIRRLARPLMRGRSSKDLLFAVVIRKSDARLARMLHDVVALVMTFGPILLALSALTAIAAVLNAAAWPWYAWVIAAPILYFGGLVLYLLLNAAICSAAGRRNPKPRHAVLHPGVRERSAETLGLATAAMCYRRLAILQSIPGITLLAQFRPFDRLVLRSYSPSIHIGRNVINWSTLNDPDLTEIEDNVILGGRCTVSAHSMVLRGSALVYVSAPVRIEERATIGGEAYISLGCVVGRDAVVEPGAVVEPFTTIRPGEVWGGNPARFRRVREDIELGASGADAAPRDSRPADTTASVAPVPTPGPGRDDVRRLVVETLGLSDDEAPSELSSATCALWDSLGQVAIAAAVFDRYGVTVEASDVFRLHSLDDIRRVVTDGTPGPEGPAEPARTPGALTTAGADEPDTVLDVEMLPLLDPQEATRLLARSMDATSDDAEPLRVEIVASFVAQPLESALKLWGRAFGFDIACRFAGYDQIVQALLTRSSSTDHGEPGVTVVLARLDDLSADADVAASELDELLDAIEHAAAAAPPSDRILVGTLPPVVSPFSAVDREHGEAMRERWRERLAAVEGVEQLDFADVVEWVGVEHSRSSQLEVLTRSGYSQRLHQELAIAVVRHIRSARGAVAKVIAVDCDNTLWGGVVGEVGLDGLQLGADGAGRSFQLFQRHLKRLQERGLLLVVVSRNEEHDVREVFERHPEMVLGTADIAAWRVNWEHKSENLRALADELSLGLDSFVFLDDDPATRLEVKTRVPAVHVVPLPGDPALYCETLARLWLFDGRPATTEDATRTLKAHEEQRRQRELSDAGLDDFLARLGLEVELISPGEHDWPRVAQLTQRTNQFNLTLKRRTIEEVKALDGDSLVLVLGARDRFGDYGQVGVCVLTPAEEPQCWELDTLLMSCRALGRGVEDAFLHGIALTAAERGGSTLLAPYRAGPRNGQVRDFLARSGFDEVDAGVWRLSIAEPPPPPKHVRITIRDSAAVS